jgi:hypothetical protein
MDPQDAQHDTVKDFSMNMGSSTIYQGLSSQYTPDPVFFMCFTQCQFHRCFFLSQYRFFSYSLCNLQLQGSWILVMQITLKSSIGQNFFLSTWPNFMVLRVGLGSAETCCILEQVAHACNCSPLLLCTEEVASTSDKRYDLIGKCAEIKWEKLCVRRSNMVSNSKLLIMVVASTIWENKTTKTTWLVTAFMWHDGMECLFSLSLWLYDGNIQY